MATPAIREAARRVGERIAEVEHNPARDRHDLRWMVECLFDELRLSLEQSWGYQPGPERRTALERKSQTCRRDAPAARGKPAMFRGMSPFEAEENLGNKPVIAVDQPPR
ncbi:hypothetical protein [Bradyrhizobium ivorense]|uniref:hypothetical protein n=1 Tax=Bradyrhizobium ivorense TaxID=2511166 RepID=UPI001117107B|nr:hypothetical protein [Bradyrhizobium ivorense]